MVALALQIGTNYANDYSDGVRGTDEVRVGPFRLTASKLVAPVSVRRAAFFFFAVAAVAGLFLSIRQHLGVHPTGHECGRGGMVLHRADPNPTATSASARCSS